MSENENNQVEDQTDDLGEELSDEDLENVAGGWNEGDGGGG